ncbi:MAG: hypothetical protein WDN10_03520 [bacterium]
MTTLRNWYWNAGILLAQLLVGGAIALFTQRIGVGIGVALTVTVLCTMAAGGRIGDDDRKLEALMCGLSALCAITGLLFLREGVYHPTSFRGPDRDWMFLWPMATLVFAAISAVHTGGSTAPWRNWFLNFLADLPLGIGFFFGGLVLLNQRRHHA